MLKISVIVPIYNAEKYMCQCLDSITTQNIQDIEIVCVNDGSTDSSLTVLHEYERKDQRIRVFSQDNKGAGSARNLGISCATGEYVAFMDPDDWYPSTDTLEMLYKKATQNGVSICGGSFSELRDNRIITLYSGVNAKYTFHEEGIIFYKDYQFDYGFHRFIYERSLLLKNNIYFPEYRRFQDPPFFVRAMICAGLFYAIPEITYRYRAGHNVIDWNVEKTNGLLRGLIDILQLSREHKLSSLHKLAVYRTNSKLYLQRFMENITLDNVELLALLLKANETISIDLLREAEPSIDIDEPVIIEPIKKIISLVNENTYENKKNVETKATLSAN